MDRLVKQSGTGLQFTVLARFFLQVDVDVAIIVAVRLVIKCRINDTELFADAGHQIGCLINGRVRQCLLQMVKGLLLIAYGMVTRG